MRFDEITTLVRDNVDTLGWHAVFLFILPSMLRYDNLQNYVNILSPLALTYAVSGKKDGLFRNLYCNKYKNIVSYTSTTLIDVLTLSGIAASAIRYAEASDDTETATIMAAITFLLLFIIPKRVVPPVVRHGQSMFDGTPLIRNMSGVISGLLVILVLLTIRCIAVQSLD